MPVPAGQMDPHDAFPGRGEAAAGTAGVGSGPARSVRCDGAQQLLYSGTNIHTGA